MFTMPVAVAAAETSMFVVGASSLPVELTVKMPVTPAPFETKPLPTANGDPLELKLAVPPERL